MKNVSLDNRSFDEIITDFYEVGTIDNKEIRKFKEIDSKIIRLLGRKKMKFTELRTFLKISKPALSRHLERLRSHHKIAYVKEGREKHYFLAQKASGLIDVKIDLFMSKFEEHLIKSLNIDSANSQKILDMLGQKIRVFFLYSFLKSILTGENWLRAFNMKELSLNAFSSLFVNYCFNSKNGMKEYRKSKLESFEEEIKHLQRNKKLISHFEDLFEKLKQTYPDDFKILEEYSK